MMSDKKNTNLNTKTSKSSSQNSLLGGTSCLWWFAATILLIIICTFCGAKLTIGLCIGMSIVGLFVGAFLAGLFGDKHAKFDVKPKHADVIEILNGSLHQESEVKNPLTEQQFRLIKTETENLCDFYSLILKKTAVCELCDTVLALKNEDGTDWETSLKMQYAFIADIHKCFLGLGQDFDAENDTNLGLCLLLTKIADPDTDITYDDYAYYKASLLDSYKGVLEISKQIIDAGQFSNNKFILQYVLGKYDKDCQLKYMTHLYRFASACSKADGKVTEQESRWLSEIMKSTEDEEVSQPAEINNPKEFETSPIEELQKLIGLSSVKIDIERLTNFIKIQQVRKEIGLKESKVSYHCIFTGNPGTGKTTVARIVASIYKELGIIKKGHLVETDRSGLVAEYVGQTAVKTNKIIDSALDGVLFIDEAYSLVQGSANDYGHEAISTLLKRMEDDRDRLIVILAGYRENMQTFINSNPGLQSRFNRYIDFQDYTSQQLFDIFMLNVKKHDYTINQKAQEKLKKLFEDAIENKDENFGNARYVRNIFEKTLENQAMRLASLTNLSKEVLSEITEKDIPVAE
jgi:SpoVK/Ycf46/Vps4 family AAA+-type ATPase